MISFLFCMAKQYQVNNIRVSSCHYKNLKKAGALKVQTPLWSNTLDSVSGLD